MYAFRNTNIVGIFFLMTAYGVILAIKDIASAKSDVNTPTKKSMFLPYCNEEVTKTPKNRFKNL